MQQALGFPGELVDGLAGEGASPRWASCSASTARSRSTWTPACTAAPAPTSATTSSARGDPKNMPVARQDLMRSVYRRYFTLRRQALPEARRRARPDARKCWTSGTATTTSAPNAAAARCSAPTASTPPKSRWRRKEIMDSSASGQKYSNEIIGKVHRIGNNLGLPGPGAGRHAGRAGRGRQGRHRRRRALSARREGRRSAAGHAVGRLLRRAARRQPDRLRQGVPRGRHQLDAVLARVRGRQLRPVHRQLRPAAARSRCASARRRWNSASSASSSANAAMPGASPTASGTR